MVEYSRDGFMAKRDNVIVDIANNSSLSNGDHLDFEEKVADLDRQMNELRKLGSVKGIDYSSEIRQLQRQQVLELKRVYSNLTAWQTVHVARHPNRPLLSDYLDLMVKDFRELHGDRCFGDDRAVVTGLGHIGRECQSGRSRPDGGNLDAVLFRNFRNGHFSAVLLIVSHKTLQVTNGNRRLL